MDFGKRFFPTRFYKFAIAFDQRHAQTVRVFMQVFERHAFGADIAVAKHILRCAADADHLFALGANFQAATGLAQRANAVMTLFGCGWRLRHGGGLWCCTRLSAQEHAPQRPLGDKSSTGPVGLAQNPDP